MPMGIKTAPAWFQRFIVETFQDFIDRNVLEIYLDDFIFNTVELDEHQQEADKLFDKMEKCNIKCAWNKSKMVTLEVDFLGNTISENKIYPNKNRAKCSSVYNAHLGRKKTMAKIIERMYRPNLKADVIQVVKTCDTCQKIKRDFSKKLAQLLILTPVKPNQLITTDIGGPLKETVRGNKYFLVIIDHFTKFIQIYAMKTIKAEDVAQVIVDDWMMKFGIPESILSDGGTQYRSI
jgi:hypothetical protein